MEFADIDWAAMFSVHRPSYEKDPPGSEASKQMWDSRAPSFSHKPKRSDYIDKLQGLMDLKDGESVFDMGCGPGTLSVPLAQQGHEVIAVDFSPQMLAELAASAENAGVADRIHVFERSWQQDWNGLPEADVSISSRSFVVNDLEDGLLKLESKAKRRAYLSTGAGDLPYRDHRIFKAYGRPEDSFMVPSDLAIIVNWLFAHGRLPEISYIEFEGDWHRGTREERVESIRRGHEPKDEREESILTDYLEEHIVESPDGSGFGLDYPRLNRWALISWDVPKKE
ncbi:MAG: methyltransferase domain-containing protein [Eggerthellaceae bacterium]|nr:methyltransferase domain-containing protein [Eggerthellaceae bacterium]